ncbi:MAG: LL-diaminopimelate aminotransferase [Chlamydiales bacterium]|nr:LL-diaminopimelate aminotransferase [Chlamydiales bacterium]
MVKRNPHFSRLNPSYLFPEVMRRAAPFSDLISLSVGDTSEPIPLSVVEALEKAARDQGTRSGYRGYGAEQGNQSLREKIAYHLYQDTISPEDIFISDGAKCDIGRLQILFGSGVTSAVQNPTYPVYVDAGLLLNQQVLYLDCSPKNNFFPETLPDEASLLFICSPNNPTGSVATHAQLRYLVEWAHAKGALIVFDAAYSGFIQDPSLPRSIYEIEGAEEVAIEVSSFSKLIGFTGVRLGWSVVPSTLTYKEGGSIRDDYRRIVTTFFNGASILSQAGGVAALEHPHEIQTLCSFYLENAMLIRSALGPKGFPIYGGENAPYLWVDFGKENSWDLFQMLLEETGIITTPGSGFGSSGEGFLRFSAFGQRQNIINAVERIQTQWPKSLSLLSI